MTELRVIHQCGTDDEAWLRDRYAAADVDAQVSAFIRDMGRAYASADLALCRAGAATCAELALCGLPALLIPLPGAVRDHQRRNAEALAGVGGVACLNQAGLTPDALAARIRALRDDPVRRERMRACLHTCAQPGATAKLADLVESPG
jgi:UDP-N-acetylglucosamine--N-acetylmuramyl-(pentapeptide) pyrophosphoryl-undecaprenol N-acetylglucosamine transferase